MSRAIQHARRPVRKPPQRLWLVWLRKATLLVVMFGLLGFAARSLWELPAAARTAHDLRARAIAATGDAGLVVTRVYSEGRTLTDERRLISILESYYGTPILAVELDQVKFQLEALAWVRSASVRRRLPDTLWVTLDEHRPIARWRDGAREVLVSDAGEVVRTDTRRFRRLPLLHGGGAPERAVDLLRLLAREPALAARVTGARLVGERRWDVQLDGRIEVRLPAERPEAAWRRLAAEQQASAVLGRAVSAIDLRHPDWLTLRVADEALPKEPGA